MAQLSSPENSGSQSWGAALPLNPSGLLQSSLKAVEGCRFGAGFVRPAYESFCFSSLPGFIERTLLGATSRGNFPEAVSRSLGEYDHVIFVFVDAFGWESFERFRERAPFLKAVEKDGLILKGTSQFPSTTAAHVTTFMSGLPAYEHEVCGWDYFEPRVGRMIKPLRFSFSEDKEAGTLARSGFTANQVLPQGNFISKLLGEDVSVCMHGPAAFYPSPFNTRYAPVRSVRGYAAEQDAIGSIIEAISEKPSRSFHSLYIDTYDSACHQHGVGGRKSDEVATQILRSLGSFLNVSIPGKTLLVVSADHGQISDRPENKIAVNLLMPSIESLLKVDSRGAPIRFSGGKRYLFLHPREEAREYLARELSSRLVGAATVMTLPELLSAGLLGPAPLKDSFAERLGSIGILPHAGFSVSWFEPPMFEDRDISGHGGASPQEMEIPILFLPLS